MQTLKQKLNRFNQSSYKWLKTFARYNITVTLQHKLLRWNRKMTTLTQLISKVNHIKKARTLTTIQPVEKKKSHQNKLILLLKRKTKKRMVKLDQLQQILKEVTKTLLKKRTRKKRRGKF
jgi:phosphoenolpyruvate carboxylase